MNYFQEFFISRKFIKQNPSKMSKKHTRKEILAHLIDLKSKEIQALEESYKIYAESADLDEESSLEYDDFAQQSQSTDSARSLQLRIDQAKNNLEYFKALRPELSDQVVEGNIVFTNKINFVIGLAFKEFEWENKKFIGISSEAPIFKVLQDKKEGDQFHFNEVEYIIEEIL